MSDSIDLVEFFRRAVCLLIYSAASIIFNTLISYFRSLPLLIGSVLLHSESLILFILRCRGLRGLLPQTTGRITHRGYSVLPRVRGPTTSMSDIFHCVVLILDVSPNVLLLRLSWEIGFLFYLGRLVAEPPRRLKTDVLL